MRTPLYHVDDFPITTVIALYDGPIHWASWTADGWYLVRWVDQMEVPATIGVPAHDANIYLATRLAPSTEWCLRSGMFLLNTFIRSNPPLNYVLNATTGGITVLTAPFDPMWLPTDEFDRDAFLKECPEWFNTPPRSIIHK
jgi:hypothetical protein